MGQMTRIHRFPWGTADDAQVLIVHFGSKSTPMIAQQLRQIGLRSRVIDAQDIPVVTASPYYYFVSFDSNGVSLNKKGGYPHGCPCQSCCVA